MNRVLQHLRGQRRKKLLVYALIQVLLLGVIDYVIGPEWFFSIFYTVPVSMMAWFVSRRGGIATSIIAAASCLLADLLAGHVYSSLAIPFWNAGAHLVFFLIITYLLSALRKASVDHLEIVNVFVYDLHSPVSVIAGALGILREFSDHRLTPEEEGVLGICQRQCNDLRSTLDSIHNIAWLESWHKPIQMILADCEQVVETLIERMPWGADDLTWSVAPEARTIRMDPDVIERILINLVRNAMNAREGTSKVSIRVEPTLAGTVAFRVRNQGKGIPPDEIRHLFSGLTLKAAKQDRDLGLAFCKLAVEAQGGRIWAESEVGKWTEFIFTLPFQPSIPATPTG